MHKRIEQIMKEKGLQPSSFADKIQVSRGTISHILNQRNKPNYDTIQKIVKSFPDISKSWLESGEGPMYNWEQNFKSQVSNSNSIQPDLFDEKSTIEPSGISQKLEYAQKNEVNKPENKTITSINQDVSHSINLSKKIDKIMIFFNDKTFMTFIPEV